MRTPLHIRRSRWPDWRRSATAGGYFRPRWCPPPSTPPGASPTPQGVRGDPTKVLQNKRDGQQAVLWLFTMNSDAAVAFPSTTGCDHASAVGWFSRRICHLPASTTIYRVPFPGRRRCRRSREGAGAGRHTVKVPRRRNRVPQARSQWHFPHDSNGERGTLPKCTLGQPSSPTLALCAAAAAQGDPRGCGRLQDGSKPCRLLPSAVLAQIRAQ